MYDSVIKLIAVTVTQNEFGGNVKTLSEREVMCEVRDVSRSDFFQAMQNGLSLTHTFIINPINYDNEPIVEYMGKRYGIVRTYQSDPDTLNIYTGEAVGINGL